MLVFVKRNLVIFFIMCRLQRKPFQRTEGIFVVVFIWSFFSIVPRSTGVYRISTGMNRMSAGVNRKSTALNRGLTYLYRDELYVCHWTVSLPGCTVTQPASTAVLTYLYPISTACQPRSTGIYRISAAVNRRQPVITVILHFSVPSDLTFFFPVYIR